MASLLDNIIWNSLTGAQAKFAAGTGGARRYARGFSPIVGFADARHPDFAALAPYCEAGEHFYCSGWDGPAPAGWRIEADATMCLMVRARETARGSSTDEARDAVRLGPQHASQALELAELTRPGPFGLRTIELGDYFGYLERGRLVAMAGERMQAGSFREISGVCTHPDFQGRGLARRLMSRLLALQQARGETSFLHVMSANAGARRLYASMGFSNYLEPVVRVIAPIA
ncbi:MAG: GNAT family N-acetyltransferase [Proteobacteria bacterium]|nr:GNAT family N-acetyltransferase [Pseudomonadota bacterium]